MALAVLRLMTSTNLDESDILDMYRRAAARSAPLSKDFCASLAQADCWEDWGAAMVAALRALGGRPRGLRLRPFGKGRPRCFDAVVSAVISVVVSISGRLQFVPNRYRHSCLPPFALVFMLRHRGRYVRHRSRGT
jgi:hypothetical protein